MVNIFRQMQAVQNRMAGNAGIAPILPAPATGPGITAQNPGTTIPAPNINTAPAASPQPVVPNTQPTQIQPAPGLVGTLGAGGATTQGQTGAAQIPPQLFPDPSNPTSMWTTYQAYAQWANASGLPPLSFGDWAALAGAPGSGGVSPTAPIPASESRPDSDPLAFPETVDFIRNILGNPPIDPEHAGMGAGRGNFMNLLAGPLFQNDPFELPGKGTGIGFAMNLLLNEVARQAPRSAELENILRDLVVRMGSSPAAQASDALVNRSAELTSPEALDRLRAERELEARQTSAAGLNAARNRLQDLGLAGMGAASSGAINQAENLANRRLFRNLRAVDEQTEADRLRRLGLAGQIAGQGADVTRALIQDPRLRLAAQLGTPMNPAMGELITNLLQTGNLQIGEALANRGGGFLEKAAPILGGVLGAIGNIVAPGIGGAVAPQIPIPKETFGFLPTGG